MTQQDQHKLGETLWKIADQLRGAMNADDFRDYMLSFLFLRYLSENYEKAAGKELGRDYPKVGDIEEYVNSIEKKIEMDENVEIENVQVELNKLIPLSIWYSDNGEDKDEFEKQMRRKVHYVIEPNYLWQNIYWLAKTHSNELLQTLEDGFKFIESKSFGSTFDGLFSEINLNSEKLGKNYTERNKKLCTIISHIEQGIAQFSTNTDILGDAYEYLIGQFAAGSGKKAGEFYTPQQLSTILSEIVTLDSQDPVTGKKDRLNNVLDFTCGSGSLLLNVRNKLGKNGIGRIYGQEKNVTTFNLARMNMLLHGVKDTEFDIYHGDTLSNDWPILNELNPAKKMKFDAIVANPPFSLRWNPSDSMAEDFRFNSYGLAPKSAADFAFLLHGFHFLGDEGTMAIILPHGVLFRGGAEQRIRTKLLKGLNGKGGNIDAVIGLPANLFYSTGIPVCIIVLKKCKMYDDILFINASEHYEKGKRQNRLRDGKEGEPNDIRKIVQTFKNRSEEDRYSRRVSMEEIEKNDFNLNISRYVSTAKPEKKIDLHKVNEDLVNIEKDLKNALKDHNKYLRELGLPPVL